MEEYLPPRAMVLTNQYVWNTAFFNRFVKCFCKKVRILIKKESESLIFTGLQIIIITQEDVIVENLFEKFNMFDMFTMLIPGVIISTLSCTSLSFEFYNQWVDWGNEKYIIFFVISYLLGIISQQMGNIIDEKFLYKIIYGGKPREIFLLKDKYKRILNNEWAYNDALNIKKS